MNRVIKNKKKNLLYFLTNNSNKKEIKNGLRPELKSLVIDHKNAIKCRKVFPQYYGKQIHFQSKRWDLLKYVLLVFMITLEYMAD